MKERLKEDFLHHVWLFKQFKIRGLMTTEGRPLEIQASGFHNKDAGPDFTNAKVKIGNTVWFGNVEIHVRSSDWMRHQHQNNPAYNNVILHVVFDADVPIYRENGKAIPCLELRRLIPSYVLHQYNRLVSTSEKIPCQAQLEEVKEVVRKTWLERLLIERLENKMLRLERLFLQNNKDWEETFYQLLTRNFGMRVNAVPFELLAKSLPLKLLRKYRAQPFQLDALIFGQAGLLEGNFTDEYPQNLQAEYTFLATKYQLQALKGEIWKYSRLRPPNFPTIRLSQFSDLMGKSEHLFREIVECESLHQLKKILHAQASIYWQEHVAFDKPTKKGPSLLGVSTKYSFIINAVIPLLFLYGLRKGNSIYQDRALKWLEEIPPEQNTIIRHWKGLGFEAKSAAQTQALLQLKNEYCDKKRCVHCAIGSSILRKVKQLQLLTE